MACYFPFKRPAFEVDSTSAETAVCANCSFPRPGLLFRPRGEGGGGFRKNGGTHFSMFFKRGYLGIRQAPLFLPLPPRLLDAAAAKLHPLPLFLPTACSLPRFDLVAPGHFRLLHWGISSRFLFSVGNRGSMSGSSGKGRSGGREGEEEEGEGNQAAPVAQEEGVLKDTFLPPSLAHQKFHPLSPLHLL